MRQQCVMNIHQSSAYLEEEIIKINRMETITVIGLLIIGIGMGFILTKGIQLNKEIKNKK